MVRVLKQETREFQFVEDEISPFHKDHVTVVVKLPLNGRFRGVVHHCRPRYEHVYTVVITSLSQVFVRIHHSPTTPYVRT